MRNPKGGARKKGPERRKRVLKKKRCRKRKTRIGVACPTLDDVKVSPARAEEVLPLVTRFVKASGWIYSDKLRAYRSNLSALGYKHFALDHSSNPPECGHPSCPEVHTQTIESVWSDLKTHFRAMQGVGHDCVELHLYEFLWRRNLSAIKKNPFHSFCFLGRLLRLCDAERGFR